MPYNLSLINGTGLVPLLQTVNQNLMFNWYGNFTLMALFAIFFMSFVTFTNDPKKSLGITSLFIAVLSVFLRTLGLVPDITVLIVWIIAAIAAAVNIFTS